MKAIVYERYGPPEVLQLRDVATPTPGDNELLINTHATTVTSGDWRVRSLDVPFGFKTISRLIFGIAKPRQPILGSEMSGVVEAVGKDVTKFKVGDAVFAYASAKMGCHAEYIVMPQDGAVMRKPDSVSFDDAAALCFGGTTALHFFRQGKLQAGERILINGASGAVGTAAVQLARHFGAHVTGVCSGANVELVRSLGADHVMDYKQENFTAGDQRYDLIMDTVGTAPYARCKPILAERGRCLMVYASMPDMLRALWVGLTSKHRIVAGPAATRVEDLQLLADLAAAGTFKPVIGKRFAFEQMVEAHRHVDTGHKRGNVVITFTAQNTAAPQQS